MRIVSSQRRVDRLCAVAGEMYRVGVLEAMPPIDRFKFYLGSQAAADPARV